MSTSDNIAELVDQMIQLDGLGKVTGPDWEVAETSIRQVFEGGRDRIHQVIAMLAPPGGADDSKPRYLLHAMAVHVACPEGEQWRTLYCNTLASRLGGDLPKPVQSFLISQLQVAGTQAVAGSLGAQLLDEELCEYATQALLAIRDGAADQLRRALPGAEGQAFLTIVNALGVLADPDAAEPLRLIARQHDAGQIGLAALAALARIGDPLSVDLLLSGADHAEGFDRIAATEACLVMAQRLIERGHRSDAMRICAHLRETRKKRSEGHVVMAAERVMAKAM